MITSRNRSGFPVAGDPHPWHFHPLGRAEPSPQDRKQMSEIARDKNYRCTKPVLAIVSPAILLRRTARVFMLGEEGELQELFAVADGSR
jgi:hypothetical protein